MERRFQDKFIYLQGCDLILMNHMHVASVYAPGISEQICISHGFVCQQLIELYNQLLVDKQ